MLKGKRHVCRFIGSGTYNDLNYVVMQLQGNNLCDLRKAQPGRHFTLSTILRLGLEMLKAIQSVHHAGYLHRDVKPANFCIGRLYHNCRRVYIVDFGLAVPYRSDTGEILPVHAGLLLKGNKCYASINELKNKELGRRDDLWSLFYILAEFANGRLPWNKLVDRKQIGEMKEKYGHTQLLLNLPYELHKFLDHIESLRCHDRPDYEMLTGLFEQSIERLRIKVSGPLDWENGTDTAVPSSTSPVILRLTEPAIIRATHISDILDSSQENIELDSNHEHEVRKIGAGGCGEVYEGVDLVTNEEVALKMESTRQGYQLLEREGYILKMLKEKHNACRFIGSGTENDLNYLVMQLQGNNLCHLRRAQPGRRLSWSTILRLGLEMLKAIHSVHQVGYLHRDVKPANFCVGRLYNNCRRVYIVDFGLAVRYRSETGKILAPLGLWLKGNKRYASINELKDKALGRRDDLWSLFYILVEFANGRLPWNELEDRTQVCKMKEKYSNRLLLLNLPFELHKFLDHLESLQCRDRPDYEMLTGLLEQSIERLRIKLSEPYDWEKATDTAVRSSISPVILRVAQPAIIRATHISDILDSSQSTEPDNNHEYETQLDCERLFDQLLQETSAPVTENPSDSKPEKGKSCNATLAATQAPNQPRDTKTELSQGSPRKQLVAQRREASMQGVDPTAEAHPHLHHFAASSAALTDNDVAFEGNNEMAQ